MNATAPFESDPTQRKKAVHVKVCMSVRAPFKEVFSSLISQSGAQKQNICFSEKDRELGLSLLLYLRSLGVGSHKNYRKAMFR